MDQEWGVIIMMDFFSILLARAGISGGGGGGTTDYTDLENKPKINNVTLEDNKSLSDIGAQPTIDNDHKLNADLVNDSSSTNKFTNASDKTKLGRIVMDPNETTTLYFQGTQPTNPSDNDCWIKCSST